MHVHVPIYQVQFVDGRFKSFSCRSPPNEMPVVNDSLGGGGHGAGRFKSSRDGRSEYFWLR